MKMASDEGKPEFKPANMLENYRREGPSRNEEHWDIRKGRAAEMTNVSGSVMNCTPLEFLKHVLKLNTYYITV